MFLLFGTRPSVSILTIVHFVCGFCDKSVAQRVVERKNKFTLFFVPLFSFSTKYHNECSNCGGLTSLSKEQAQNALGWAAQTSTP